MRFALCPVSSPWQVAERQEKGGRENEENLPGDARERSSRAQPRPESNRHEDSGPFTLALAGISPGPTNEVSQHILGVTAAIVNASPPGLITNLMVNATNAANAALSYAVAPNLQGSAQIRITVQDDGGTANGGSDTFTRDFIVTVTEVDDPPYLKQASETQVFLEDQFAGNANVAVVDLANVFGDPDGVAINLVLGVA